MPRPPAVNNPSSSDEDDSSDEISDSELLQNPTKPTDSDEDSSSDDEEKETLNKPLNPIKPPTDPEDEDEESSSDDERETINNPLNPTKPPIDSEDEDEESSSDDERETPGEPGNPRKRIDFDDEDEESSSDEKRETPGKPSLAESRDDVSGNRTIVLKTGNSPKPQKKLKSSNAEKLATKDGQKKPVNAKKPAVSGNNSSSEEEREEGEDREIPDKLANSPKPKTTSQRPNLGASKSATEQKKTFWTEDAEVAVLKGMHDFRAKTGVDPYSDRGAFYEFVKKLVPFEVTRKQVMDKVLRLKMKFEKNGMSEGKLLEASRLIWGLGAIESGARNEKRKATSESNNEKSFKKAKKEAPLNVGKENGKGVVVSAEDLVMKESNGEKSPKKAKKEKPLIVGKDKGKGVVVEEGSGKRECYGEKSSKKAKKANGKGIVAVVEEGSGERECNGEKSSKKAKKANGKGIVAVVEEGSVERESKGEKSAKKAKTEKPLNVAVENGEKMVVDKVVLADEVGILNVAVENGERMVVGEVVLADEVGFWDKYPRLKEALEVENFGSFSKDGKTKMVKDIGIIGDEMAKELEDEWKRIQVKEAKLKLMKLDLIRKQTKVVIEKLMNQQ